ncbi:MAG TPA: SPOR domain-containing protein, partial [Bryobacteraceae bacterium]|nr:SPOR domain-containing protein [Bryobacteraceae bacterium]
GKVEDTAKAENQVKTQPPPKPAPAVKPLQAANTSNTGKTTNTALTLITPRSGETYLQLAALSPTTVLKYLDELRANQLEPSVAPGPNGSILVRVVVGPFPDQASLTRAKDHLNASKLEWIIRSY